MTRADGTIDAMLYEEVDDGLAQADVTEHSALLWWRHRADVSAEKLAEGNLASGTVLEVGPDLVVREVAASTVPGVFEELEQSRRLLGQAK